jgi:hypothetical protein
MEAALWGRLNNVKGIREVQTSAMLWPFILTARPDQCPAWPVVAGLRSDRGSFQYQITSCKGLGTYSRTKIIVIVEFEIYGIQKGHFRVRDRV